MKILFVSSWYPPVLTGSSLWTESLVLSLRQRGHDVRVISSHWKGSLRESKKSEAEIKEALERDKFMTPKEAKDFGLIDEVVEKRS